jgi:hypothetical protein
LMVWLMQRGCLCQCCAGALARIALASLLALRMRCCRHCIGVVVQASLLHPVGIIALDSPASILVSQTGIYPVPTPLRPGIFPSTVLASLLALHWCSCPHQAGVIASIALSLSPAPCRHCPPHHVGISPLLCWRFCPCCPPHCCQHFKLASAQSRHSCNTLAYVGLLLSPCHCRWLCCRPWHHSTATWPSMVRPMQRWRLYQRCAGVLARMLLASLQALVCCCCRHCTGAHALAARASLPLSCWHHQSSYTRVAASIANWRLLVTTQSHPLAYVTSLAFSLSLPVVRCHTRSHPRQLGLWPMPRWPICRCCAGILAHIALASLQALHCVLGHQANLKESSKSQGACGVEATSISCCYNK